MNSTHETERKSFETKMKAEYKLKKERWKKEMESQDTPKSQRNQGIYVSYISLTIHRWVLEPRIFKKFPKRVLG